MSDKSKRGPKPGPSSPVEQKNWTEPKNAVSLTPGVESDDPRGKFLFYGGKKVRLIKCEHNKLSPLYGLAPDGQTVAGFERYACSLEVETLPPNRYVHAIYTCVLLGEIRNLTLGPIIRPEWNTPYEFRSGMVIDVAGGEWLIEKASREEILEDAGGEVATLDAVAPGWRRGKLVLKRLPNGREPAVFGFGKKEYTVPAGKAWKIVLDMIEADAFEGHGVEIPLRASDSFRRNHRMFFTEIVRTDSDGRRHLRTK